MGERTHFFASLRLLSAPHCNKVPAKVSTEVVNSSFGVAVWWTGHQFCQSPHLIQKCPWNSAGKPACFADFQTGWACTSPVLRSDNVTKTKMGGLFWSVLALFILLLLRFWTFSQPDASESGTFLAKRESWRHGDWRCPRTTLHLIFVFLSRSWCNKR